MIPVGVLAAAATRGSGGGGEPDPHWESVVALLRFNGNTADETGLVWSEVAPPAYAAGRFGMAGQGNGSTAILEGPNNLLASDEPFTVEGFVWLNEVGGVVRLISQSRRSTNGDQDFVVLPDQIIWRDLPHSSGSTIISISVPTEEWIHVAFVYDGSARRIYLGGEQIGGDSKGGWRPNAWGVRVLGGHNGSFGQSGSSGRLDELRVTKGVARYTSSFSPPSAPFPAHGP